MARKRSRRRRKVHGRKRATRRRTRRRKPKSPSSGKKASNKAGAAKATCSKRRVIVIDPGHGGKKNLKGSSSNNAIAYSKVLEKTLTLQYAKSLQRALMGATVKAILKSRGFNNVQVILTRGSDKNLSAKARRAVATKNKADIFVSIHFNGWRLERTRGTETYYRPSGSGGQSNAAADKGLAQKVNSALYKAIKALDSGAKNRGVKAMKLGVIRDTGKGYSCKMCRSVLMEVDFITNKKADKTLVSGKNATQNRDKIMMAVAKALAKTLW